MENVSNLGDGESLLLHDFVQDRADAVAHLIELVNAADAVVAEHQRSGLKDQLPGLRVLHHVGCETHSAGALAGRVLAAGYQVVDVLQQLGLAGSRVSTQQDVHLCTEVATASVTEVLTSATKQLEQNALETRKGKCLSSFHSHCVISSNFSCF